MNEKYLQHFIVFSIAIHISIFALLMYKNPQTSTINNITENIHENFELLEIDLNSELENIIIENEKINLLTSNKDLITMHETLKEYPDAYDDDHVIIDNKSFKEIQQKESIEQYINITKDQDKFKKTSLQQIKKQDSILKNNAKSDIKMQINSVTDQKLLKMLQFKLSSCWNAPMVLSDFDNIKLYFRIKLNEKGKITDVILRNKGRERKQIIKLINNNFNRAIIKCIPSNELQNFDYKFWKTLDLTLQSKFKNLSSKNSQ